MGKAGWTVGILVALAPGGLAFAEAAKSKAEAAADARREGVIEARLEAEEVFAGRGLDVKVDGKKATLTGTVKSDDEKALAERLTKEAGVVRVNNQLQIVPGPATEVEGSAAAPAASPQSGSPTRGALSDPQRKDPLVGSMPAELTPTREARFRSMGMPDPKAPEASPEGKTAAAKGGEPGAKPNTMQPTVAPATGSDHRDTGNQSAPPQQPPPSKR